MSDYLAMLAECVRAVCGDESPEAERVRALAPAALAEHDAMRSRLSRLRAVAGSADNLRRAIPANAMWSTQAETDAFRRITAALVRLAPGDLEDK